MLLQSLTFLAGLAERGVDGEYVWSDKSETNYFNWAPRQPSDSINKDNCVLMVKADNYKWNDLICSEDLPYLCQYSQYFKAVLISLRFVFWKF